MIIYIIQSNILHFKISSKPNSRRQTTVSERGQTQTLFQGKQNQEKTNIQVFVRARPLTLEELKNNQDYVIVRQPQFIEIRAKETYPHIQQNAKVYTFEKVFGPQTTQEEVYNSTVSHNLMDEFLKGYNCSLLAYGMTGSGKTYTLKNLNCQDPNDRGITQRFTEELFKRLNNLKIDYQLRVSYVEVYCEEIYDLLAENQDFREPLKLYEEKDPTSKSQQTRFQLQNVTQILVQSPNDVMKLLNNAQKNLMVAETKMNEHSSRSHAIFSFQLLQQMQDPNSPDAIIVNTGSESISKSQNDPRSQRQHEASKINKSLLTLGRCITALQSKQNFIPLRESKLTRILADSLQGQSITAFIATISLSDRNLAETVNTLEYMTRAKKITLQLQPPKIEQGGKMLSELTTELNRLRRQQEIERLENGGMWIDNDEWQEYKNWKDKKHEEIDKLNEELEKVNKNLQNEKSRYQITKNELNNAIEQFKRQINVSNVLLNKVNEMKQFNEIQTQNINKVKNAVLQNNSVVSSDENLNGLFQSILQQVQEYGLIIKHVQVQLNKQVEQSENDLSLQLKQHQEQIKNVLSNVIKPQNIYIKDACNKISENIDEYEIQNDVQIIQQNHQQIIDVKLSQLQSQMIKYMQQVQKDQKQTISAIQQQSVKDNDDNKKQVTQISGQQNVLQEQVKSFLEGNLIDNLQQFKQGILQVMNDQQEQVRQQVESLLQQNKEEFEAIVNKSVQMLISISQQKSEQITKQSADINVNVNNLSKALDQQLKLNSQTTQVYQQLVDQQSEKHKQYQELSTTILNQLEDQLNIDLDQQVVQNVKQLQQNTTNQISQITGAVSQLYQLTEENVLKTCQDKQKELFKYQQKADQDILKLYTNMLDGDKLINQTQDNGNAIKQNLQIQMNQCVQVLKDYYPEIYSKSTIQGYISTPQVQKQVEYRTISLPGEGTAQIQGLVDQSAINIDEKEQGCQSPQFK